MRQRTLTHTHANTLRGQTHTRNYSHPKTRSAGKSARCVRSLPVSVFVYILIIRIRNRFEYLFRRTSDQTHTHTRGHKIPTHAPHDMRRHNVRTLPLIIKVRSRGSLSARTRRCRRRRRRRPPLTGVHTSKSTLPPPSSSSSQRVSILSGARDRAHF